MAAEAVGLAASVGGLIGLSGQVLQGGLFIRQFFDDIRDAPAEVLDLKDELELFTFVARDTENLFYQASSAGILIKGTTFTRTLQRCSQVVEDIGQKLEKYAGKFKVGSKPWWARLRVAARKDTLAEYLRRLERAKGQLLVLQSNLTHALLLAQHDLVQRNSEMICHNDESSTMTTQIALRTSHHLDATVRIVEYRGRAKVDLQNDSDRVASRQVGETFPNAPHSDKSDEESVNGQSRCEKENLVIPPAQQLSSFKRPHLPEKYIPRTKDISRGSPFPLPPQKNMWKKISGQYLDFWLLKVELETQEEGPIYPTDVGYLDSTQKPPQRSSTQAHFRVPYFKRKITFSMQSLPFSPYGWDMQLRTYNIIPSDSPIFVACANLDLALVRDLLENQKAASIFDYYHERYWGECSLVDRTFVAICRTDKREIAEQGVELINYLLPFYADNPRMLNHGRFRSALLPALNAEPDVLLPSRIDAFRAILLHTTDSPFKEYSQFAIGPNIHLKQVALPLSSFLVEQVYHDIDANYSDDMYYENDRIMLSDPNGQIMRDRIRADQKYAFFCEVSFHVGIAEAMYGLLKAAFISSIHKVKLCCGNRLSFLLQFGHDILEPRCIMLERIFGYEGLFTPVFISVLQFAQQLNLYGLFATALADAGWDERELLDEQFYYGIPDLLDGKIQYMTRSACRREFITDLVEGKFLEFWDDEEDRAVIACGLIAFSTGTDEYAVQNLIRRTNSELRQKIKRVPGAWHDGGKIRLVPGVDFDPWIWSMDMSHKLDVRDWLVDDDETTDSVATPERPSSRLEKPEWETMDEDYSSDEDTSSEPREMRENDDEGKIEENPGVKR